MRLGVDLGGTKIEAILLEDDGVVAERARVDTPGGSYADTLEALCQLVESLQSKSSTLLTVGVGTPGALTTPDGIMKNCNSICLNGEPLKKDIESRLGYEIRIENDANCFVLSEAHYGAGKDVDTVFGVILGTGTGGGVVINKQLHTGPNSIAGEWGHNCIPASVRELIQADRSCYCGRRNCIETVLSGRGLKQSYLEQSEREADAMEIASLARDGDAAASACIQVYCKQLAECLSTIVNVIDPDMIVLGGGLSNIEQLYNTVPDLMREIVFTDNMLTELSPPSFGDSSGALGAACLWAI